MKVELRENDGLNHVHSNLMMVSNEEEQAKREWSREGGQPLSDPGPLSKIGGFRASILCLVK